MTRYDPEIMDAAFDIIMEAERGPVKQLPATTLKKRFPSLRPVHIEDILSTARSLVAGCYDPAEKARDGILSHAQALAELKTRYPGFKSETYVKALSWGYFLSR